MRVRNTRLDETHTVILGLFWDLTWAVAAGRTAKGSDFASLLAALTRGGSGVGTSGSRVAPAPALGKARAGGGWKLCAPSARLPGPSVR